MPEEPIRAGQGIYQSSASKKDVGVCLVIDEQNLWKIEDGANGSTVITIPAGSKWKVTTENPTGDKRKVVIFRDGGSVHRTGPFEIVDEILIPYEHPND
jgi:hypothetical protein